MKLNRWFCSLFFLKSFPKTICSSTNPSFDNSCDRYITEVGILDDLQNLVMVGKLSRPIKLGDASTASLELTIDF